MRINVPERPLRSDVCNRWLADPIHTYSYISQFTLECWLCAAIKSIPNPMRRRWSGCVCAFVFCLSARYVCLVKVLPSGIESFVQINFTSVPLTELCAAALPSVWNDSVICDPLWRMVVDCGARCKVETTTYIFQWKNSHILCGLKQLTFH